MDAQCSRRLVLSTTMYHDRGVAASETQSSGHKKPIMFMDGRGHGVGSPIKGRHQKFGGTWKQKLHGRYTPALITNEYNLSQTCLFCFYKLSQPMVAVSDQVETTNGSFACLDAQCAQSIYRRLPRSSLCDEEYPNRVKRDKFNQSVLSFFFVQKTDTGLANR